MNEARLQHGRRSLPEHVDIAAGKKKRLAVLENLVETETQVSDLSRAQRKAEADLEPVRQRKVRDQERVDSGSVTDPKQLQSLLDEIEHLGRRIGELEDAELEVMAQLEEAESEQQRLTEQRSALEDQLRGWMASRDRQLSGLDAELESAANERAALVAVLPRPLVEFYEKVRANRDGLGVAELRSGRCGGCRIDINAADLREFMAASPDTVLRCEECGRILVRTAEAES